MTNRAFSTTEDRVTAAPEPNATMAAERAVEAAQRIVVERLELLRLDLVDAAVRLVDRIGLVLFAGFMIALGWCGLAVALVMVLANRFTLPSSVALVAGVHVLAGIVFYAVATASRGGKTP
jgi:hypothetical protein